MCRDLHCEQRAQRWSRQLLGRLFDCHLGEFLEAIWLDSRWSCVLHLVCVDSFFVLLWRSVSQASVVLLLCLFVLSLTGLEFYI